MIRRVAVHKFGGAALADAAAVHAAAGIIAGQAAEARCVVVASALLGVTDALLDVVHHASLVSREETAAAIARLRTRHLDVIGAVVDADAARTLVPVVDRAFEELGALAAAARLTGGAGLRELDLAAARGERLAAQILAAALVVQGVRAVYVDATDVIHTDGNFGHAVPDIAITARAARRVIEPLLADGLLPIIPGFVAAGPRGEVVTLGRGGSDLSATVLGRALGARDIVLWKDVPGLLTADPRAVPDARVIRQLHVREAAEIAQYGARVLHPAALVPVTARTRVFVRAFADPTAAGTEISSRDALPGAPVQAVAATMDQVLVAIVGRGLFARPGIVARAFTALDAAGVGAALISQAATEYAFAFTVPATLGAAAVTSLKRALARELAAGEIESVDVRAAVATVGIVGLRLAGEPGVAARVFAALAAAGINVLAAAQGSGSGGSLSLVIDATRAVEAQVVIHREFELHKQGGGRSVRATHTDVVLLGAGTIGRALLAQLAEQRRAGTGPLRVCGVIDSSGYVFAHAGLSPSAIASLVRHKQAGGALATLKSGIASGVSEAIASISAHALSRPVLVDATAAETGLVLELALSRGWDIVLANKAPLAVDLADVDRLHSTALVHGRRILHEATVGAGLPVIDTLRKLVAAGDRILSIEGCPSGTLGYLFGELGRGRSFSDALRTAVAAGYAEPDPRIDLSGLDVARKALILGRLVGFTGNLVDVAVESLVAPQLAAVPREAFLERLGELDAAWEARVRAARAAGKVLRYRARVTPRRISVGLVSVSTTDPLGTLCGTDNQFAFTTTRYRPQPLVITGPGAGPAVTAAGIVNDLLQLANASPSHHGKREARGRALDQSG